MLHVTLLSISLGVLAVALPLLLRELTKRRAATIQEEPGAPARPVAVRRTRPPHDLPSLDDEVEAEESTLLISKPLTRFEDAFDAAITAGPLRIKATGMSKTGRTHVHNEDRLLVEREARIFAVADGMGGHRAGEVASDLAVSTLRKFLCGRAVPFASDRQELTQTGKVLVGAFDAANHAVYGQARADRDQAGMGTTLVAARFSEHSRRAYIGYVGDSRCYRLRGGRLLMLTRDHTLGELGVVGPLASDLRRALGTHRSVVVDVTADVPHPGDLYLLCSDGLSKQLSDDAIRALLEEHDGDLDATAGLLVARAREVGGHDDVTVLLIEVAS